MLPSVEMFGEIQVEFRKAIFLSCLQIGTSTSMFKNWGLLASPDDQSFGNFPLKAWNGPIWLKVFVCRLESMATALPHTYGLVYLHKLLIPTSNILWYTGMSFKGRLQWVLQMWKV